MKKLLIALDLDGTLLSDSAKNEIPENVLKTIQSLKKKGHIVCIFTGRPWRATKTIYKKLGLDTIVANYNGAHLHHPLDHDTFIPIVETIPVTNALRIIESEEVAKIASNIAVEGSGYLHTKLKKEHDPFTDTFLKVDENTKTSSPISWKDITSNPTGVLIEINEPYKNNLEELKDYFMSKYGDLADFSYWETGYGKPILEFTNPLARKDIALIRLARYYGISMSNTIAFGDGYNDLQMIKVAGVGVAMNNAVEVLKSQANVVSHFTNKEGGIAKFLSWYFKKGKDIVKKTIYSLNPAKQTEAKQLITNEDESKDKFEPME